MTLLKFDPAKVPAIPAAAKMLAHRHFTAPPRMGQEIPGRVDGNRKRACTDGDVRAQDADEIRPLAELRGSSRRRQ
jgi:hypothetical protein